MNCGPYELVLAPTNYPGNKYREKYCYEHHYVYWLNTGKILKSNETIHHINRNKRDNAFKNLKVIDRGKHVAHHNTFKTKLKITVVCDYCNKEYEMPLWKYKWKKKNKQNFFCSRRCIGFMCGTGR